MEVGRGEKGGMEFILMWDYNVFISKCRIIIIEIFILFLVI